jgi:hypothetical protein
MAYSGKFQPQQPNKYIGNTTNIVWRSLWELGVMKWLDTNESVRYWSSEEEVVPYFDSTTGKHRRYFMDFKVTFTNGKTILIEVKPESQIRKPIVAGKKVTKGLLESIATYSKNSSKWNAAEEYCKVRGWSFQIWGETVLAKLGIKTTMQVKRSLR